VWLGDCCVYFIVQLPTLRWCNAHNLFVCTLCGYLPHANLGTMLEHFIKVNSARIKHGVLVGARIPRDSIKIALMDHVSANSRRTDITSFDIPGFPSTVVPLYAIPPLFDDHAQPIIKAFKCIKCQNDGISFITASKRSMSTHHSRTHRFYPQYIVDESQANMPRSSTNGPGFIQIYAQKIYANLKNQGVMYEVDCPDSLDNNTRRAAHVNDIGGADFDDIGDDNHGGNGDGYDGRGGIGDGYGSEYDDSGGGGCVQGRGRRRGGINIREPED
jgi:hypothetical protein